MSELVHDDPVAGTAAATAAGTKAAADAPRPLARVAGRTALASIVLPLTAFATGPLLARSLGPEGRGEVLAVMAPLFVLSFLANAGLPEATTYGIARLRLPGRRVALLVARLTLAYGVLAAAGLWFAAPLLLRNVPEHVTTLRWALLALPLLMLVHVLRFAANGMRAYLAANLERVLNPLVRLAAFVVLAAAGLLTVENAVLWQVLASLVGGAVLARVVLRARQGGAVPAEEPPHLGRHLAGYGARAWSGVLGHLVNWRLDQVVLVVLVTPVQLGYYAVAVNVAEIPSTVTNQLRNVLFAEAAHRDSADLIARAVRAAVLLSGTAAVLGAAAAPIAVPLLFGDDFAPAVPITQLLLVATVPFCVEQLVSAGLLASGHPGKRAVGQLTAATVTLVGLLLLAPRYGALGAATTSLLAYSSNCALSLLVFRRVSGVPLRTLVLPTSADAQWLLARARGVLRGRRRSRAARAAQPDGAAGAPVASGPRHRSSVQGQRRVVVGALGAATLCGTLPGTSDVLQRSWCLAGTALTIGVAVRYGWRRGALSGLVCAAVLLVAARPGMAGDGEQVLVAGGFAAALVALGGLAGALGRDVTRRVPDGPPSRRSGAPHRGLTLRSRRRAL